MNARRAVYAINDIRDDYIENAQIVCSQKRISVWKTVGALAACAAVVLAVWGGTRFFSNEHTQPDPSLNTQIDAPQGVGPYPQLYLPERETGKGETSYFAYDVSELIDKDSAGNHPFQSLTVYQNTLTVDEEGRVTAPDFERMKLLLSDAAKRLGVNPNLPVNEIRSAEDDALDAYVMENDTYRISVNTFLCVNITILDSTAVAPLQLPAEATREDLQATAKKTIKQFSSFLNMDHPKIMLPRGEYDVYGKQTWNQFSVCAQIKEVSGGTFLQEQFFAIRFLFDEEGCLSNISWRYSGDLSAQVGNYPIMKKSAAKKLACETFGLDESAILYTELFYDTNALLSVFAPYYRLYVQTDDTNIGASLPGMHTYTVYELPAVEPYVISSQS